MPEHSRRRDRKDRVKATEPVDLDAGGEEPRRPNGSIFLEIQGNLYIKGDLILDPGPRDNPRSLLSPSRTPTRTSSRRLQPEKSKRSKFIAPKRPTKPPQRPRLHSDRKKRDQADEGYHTSGTVSYTAYGGGKGKGKERSTESETDSTSYYSDPGEEGQANDEGVDEDIIEENEDASDDVCSLWIPLSLVVC